MTWFKVDDSFGDHPKVKRIPRKERFAAVGLWTVAGTWCAKHLTNGELPKDMVEEFLAPPRLASLLVAAGLWIDAGEAYLFHDWEKWQPSREQVEDKRAASAERQRRAREKAAAARKAAESRSDEPPPDDDPSRVSHGVTDGVTNGVSHTTPDPTRPDPTRTSYGSTKGEEQTSSDSADAEPDEESDRDQGEDSTKANSKTKTARSEVPRPDVDRLCALLVDQLDECDYGRPNITQEWRRQARLLLDKDGVALDLAEHVLCWAVQDSFWGPNIQSMPTFRAKFKVLRARRRAEHEQAQRVASPPSKPSTTDARVGAVLELVNELRADEALAIGGTQ